MAPTESSPEDLENSRDHRVLRQRIALQQVLVANLRLAKRSRIDLALDPALIEPALKQAEDELSNLTAQAGGRIEPRKKAKVDSIETCTVYIDECGTHSLMAKEEFGAFCLAGVIVRDKDLEAFEAKWKHWKLENLGAELRKVHEPDVRRRTGSFWLGKDTARQDKVIASLSEVLGELDYTAIACVLHREKYLEQYGDDVMDASLPRHGYLMTVHFLAERVAMALQHQFGGAKARLILESRGPKEDALIQYEFARLFLDGTAYLAPGYFRRQFFPGLEFKSKDDHVTGLEIADLVARPCADKVLDPRSDPARWQDVRKKLCQGQGTKHSILGLKVVPWAAEYADLWKS
ncbi:MAG TPA: DUF3800 domain-containing protein [Candidatus Tumulicola sp.]|jgi:hypothetical protein